MRQTAIAILFFTILHSSFSSEPSLIAPDYAFPGDMIQVSLKSITVQSMSVSLADYSGHVVSRAEGFLWKIENSKAMNVALLGLPSTLSAGSYTLKLQAKEGRANWQIEKDFTVRRRKFPERVINITNRMNDIYTNKSERKQREGRELWSLLNVFNPDSLFYVGKFISPLANAVTSSEFGENRRFHMPDGTEKISIHFGQDLWQPLGTEIVAVGGGRVVMAKERIISGNSVIIEHLPGLYTYYQHLDSILVRLGEKVSQGTVIGTIGKTGFATDEHLHWELRVGSVPVLPSQFFDSPLIDTDALLR